MNSLRGPGAHVVAGVLTHGPTDAIDVEVSQQQIPRPVTRAALAFVRVLADGWRAPPAPQSVLSGADSSE